MGIDITHIQNNKAQIALKEKKTSSFFLKDIFVSKKMDDKKKTIFYKDLNVLLKAGIDFKTALTIIRDQQPNKHIKEILDRILIQVISGKSLHQAMKNTGAFSPYEIFSIEIGENTRKLDVISNELEHYFQRKVKLRKQIVSILTYPAFILILTFGTLYFMLTYVVPLFETVFNQFGKDLPVLTKYIIKLSDNFNMLLAIFIGVLVLLYLFIQKVRHTIKFRNITSRFILKIPFFSKLVREIYLTRFCQSMALLLVSKTSLVASIKLIEKMIGFYPIEIALNEVSENIVKGKTLGDSLSKFKVFDGNLVSMVQVAERVNQLDSMFLNLANQYDQEVEHKTKVMGTIIEPLLIVFIGCIVGVIMVAMYAPMFDLSKVIGNG
ncbi:MAG: type II secretion system F family protein [Patiriisocius sp.]|uniref:type II secretion system F family protein n=1 Tax=Patiriisocius sp. TaxID=2822396 RepID=UPI003EF7A537